MGRGKERTPLTDAGEAALNISIGVVRNVLDGIDSGATTDEIRASLTRVENGKAIKGKDTGLFVLNLSQKTNRE